MPRIVRVVAPRLPHHITQRGNRRRRSSFASRTRSGSYAVMNGAGSPWGVSHSSGRLRNSSAGRSGLDLRRFVMPQGVSLVS